MDKKELFKVHEQASVLINLLPVYSGKTIDNILDQLCARLKYNASLKIT